MKKASLVIVVLLGFCSILLTSSASIKSETSFKGMSIPIEGDSIEIEYSIHRIADVVTVNILSKEYEVDGVLCGEYLGPMEQISPTVFVGIINCNESSMTLYFLSKSVIIDSSTIECPDWCTLSVWIGGWYPIGKMGRTMDGDSLYIYRSCENNPFYVKSFTLEMYKNKKCIYTKYRDGNVLTEQEISMILDSLRKGDLLLVKDLIIEPIYPDIKGDTLKMASLWFPYVFQN